MVKLRKIVFVRRKDQWLMSRNQPFPESSPHVIRPENGYVPAGARPGSQPMADQPAVFTLATPEEPGAPLRFPRGPWGWWLRLTMPRIAPDVLMNTALRERMRRAQILSTLLLVTLAVVIGLIPLAF